MAFQQLYYTSCETGLLGYGGFQFNAVTPGVSAAVMREVEDLTSYEPPRDLPADPPPAQLGRYPVAFSYAPGGAGGCITARTVFAGADYSGRPGNYFAHALVAGSAADYGGLLPAELWDAPLWRAEPAPATELPALAGPPPRGPLDRATVHEIIQGGHPAVLPALLTAVGQAMTGDRPVLLAGQDSSVNAAWIAAASYLLGELAWRLSFTTYTSRPAYSRHHLIGVLASAGPALAGQGFCVCDPAAGQVPELPLHPLATLLARAGIRAAESVWSAARSLATGQEAGFDDWYPVLAAAAVLAGQDLEPADMAAVMTWLRGDQGTSRTRVLTGLLNAIDAAGRLPGGLPVAELHALGALVSSDAARGRLDDLALAEALTRLRRREPAGAVALYTSAARQKAAREILTGLSDIPAEDSARAVALLEWARAAGVVLPAADLRQYGYSYLDPFGGDPAVLAAILSGEPAIAAGLIARLAQQPGMARELFDTPGRAAAITSAITLADLGDHQQLAELWLLAAVTAGDTDPVDAFAEIAGRRKPGQADAALLSRLWPGRCPAGDLARLLAQARGPELGDWLAGQVTAALEDHSGPGQPGLLQALKERPDIQRRLRPETLRLVSDLSAVGSLVSRARRDPGALAQLYTRYPQLDRGAAAMVRRDIVSLLTAAPALGPALRGCPGELRTEFCRHLRTQLSAFNADAELAARVFSAEQQLQDGSKDDKATAAALRKEFQAVRQWRGRQVRAMRRALDGRYAGEFDSWRERNRAGGMVRGLLRGFRREGD